ncbi:MAG: hypothetical protein K9I31_06445 [Chitinophagaceae bacterium]|nr:hypothetical protein [Chitinophagaceae bacterium]
MKKQICFYFKNISLIILFMLAVTKVNASMNRDTLRVLFVGNSYIYYNNLPQMVSLLSDSLNTKLICKKSTYGGSTLGDHWNSRKGLRTREILEQEKFDIVIIQDNSMWPLEHADSVSMFGKLFCDLIKSKNATPYIYNTWSREATPQTQPAINKVYEDLAMQTNSVIVPVGSIWAEAKAQKPTTQLYVSDGSHPSPMGTFLIALCFVKKITGVLPTKYATVYNYPGIDNESIRLMQVPEQDIYFFSKLVNNYLK